MQESLKKLPWNDMTPAAQAKIKQVANAGSPLFRRMPQQTVYADPEICNFLLQHPDVVIGFWEQLGVTQISLKEVKENHFVMKESTGTSAAIEVLHRTANLCVVYAKGEYRGPFIAKAHQGDVILIMRTQNTRDEMNEPMVVCDLDVIIQINSLGAEVLAKLFFSTLGKVADSNFEVTISFVGQVSKAAFRNPYALKDTAEEITSIRKEVYEEFCEVIDRAAMRYARRNRPEPSPSLSATQQQHQPIPPVRATASNQDFKMSLSESSEFWSSDPFFSSPKPAYTFESAIGYERSGEFMTPNPAGSNRSENTSIPRLPKPQR
jgi:hypothetical protein